MDTKPDAKAGNSEGLLRTVSAVIGPDSGGSVALIPVPELVKLIVSYAQRLSDFIHVKTVTKEMSWQVVSMWYIPSPVAGGGSAVDKEDNKHKAAAAAAAGAGGGTLIVADRVSDQFYSLSLATCEERAFCGSGFFGRKDGTSTTACFESVYCIVADPLRPRSWFVSDSSTIRRFDEATDTVTTLIGGIENGANQFEHVSSFVVSKSGLEIWAVDQHNSALKRVTIDRHSGRAWISISHSVQTGPNKIVWDRTPTAKSESGLWCACDDGVTYFSTEPPPFTSTTGQHEMVHHLTEETNGADDLVCTDTGLLVIFIVEDIMLYDPRTKQSEILLQRDESDDDDSRANDLVLMPTVPVLVDGGRRLYFASERSIRFIDLPPVCYPIVTCCDRDK